MKDPCARLAPLLSAWLVDEARPDEGAQIEAHLQSCAPCRAEAAALRAVLVDVRALRAEEPAPRDERFWHDFSRDLRLRLDAGAARPRRRMGWVLAPLALGLGALLLAPHAPRPARQPAAAPAAAPAVDEDWIYSGEDPAAVIDELGREDLLRLKDAMEKGV